MRRFITFGPALLVLLTATVALFAAPSLVLQVNAARIAASISAARATLDQGTQLERVNAEHRAVVDAVMPGVAHISVRYRTGGRSTGAGWLWDDQGHVVTNAHVVDNASRIDVQLYDGRVKRARVVGADRFTDIAVLDVDEDQGLFPARRAERSPLHLGERVFAFGSPFDIRFSVSMGVVSGLGRSEAAPMLNMINGFTNYIQTDAAMNPGNSGGPIADVNGRIIGMSTAIANETDRGTRFRPSAVEDVEDPAVRSILQQMLFELNSPFKGQSAGIGFAIPLETIESVVPQLLGDDVVLRGYLGVRLENASRLPLRGGPAQGVAVAQITPGQPASRSSLRVGDIILAVDDRPTPDIDVLRSAISIREPGDALRVKVWRNGEEQNLKVTIGAAYMSGAGDLTYVPGSERMTEREIRRQIDRDR